MKPAEGFGGKNSSGTKEKANQRYCTIIDLRFVAKPMVNNTNEVIKGILRAAEDKERDNAAKKIVEILENAADAAIKNEVMLERLVDPH